MLMETRDLLKSIENKFKLILTFILHFVYNYVEPYLIVAKKELIQFSD